MRRILTIAASDSGGGAGIQADLKAIALMGGFGMSAITALTAQNTTGVQAVYPVPAAFVARQINAVISDIGVDAVKTGMLANGRIVKAVSRILRCLAETKIIVDPVIVAKGGAVLLEKEAYPALKRELIPLAFIITPNLHEASVLTGTSTESVPRMKKAAHAIHLMGARNVLVKGGHLKGRAIDILYDGRDYYELASDRIESRNTHGTGCTLSAALAMEIAGGAALLDAVKRAKEFVTAAIRSSIDLGHGCGPLNPYASFSRHQEVLHCGGELKRALAALKDGAIGHLIPEVQSNLGYALPLAAGPEDVVAFPGRIIRLNAGIAAVADPLPGASRHIAQIILTAMKYRSGVRSAMNIRYSPEIIRKCRTLRLTVASFERADEPADVKETEGSSLSWGIDRLIGKKGAVPDIIYDLGDMGKEPMVRVMGINPMDVAEKVLKIAH
jgi:hydroxymethylpyrimidine/phosphomethylpyrimidine kinase